MSIYVCREPDAVGIIIEGIPVLTNLGNLAKACCFLLGLTYALNLEYPSKLSKTFEVFQTLFVGLDTLRPKPSPKFMTLKNCHCTCEQLFSLSVQHHCRLDIMSVMSNITEWDNGHSGCCNGLSLSCFICTGHTS